MIQDEAGRYRCRTCEKWFDPKSKRGIACGGFIDQCPRCSAESGDACWKYLGVHGRTNKGGDIHVIRTNLNQMRAHLRRANAVGFNANLPVGNPTTAHKTAWGKSSEAGSEKAAKKRQEKQWAADIKKISK
jgi:hypothetical protein